MGGLSAFVGSFHELESEEEEEEATAEDDMMVGKSRVFSRHPFNRCLGRCRRSFRCSCDSVKLHTG